MITNFPESISTSILNNFTFGDAEARDDALLKNCHIQTSAINELIQDNKDIVLGHRGTGKSAIVRLFEEGVFSFKKEQNQKSIIIVFDEEFNYRSIKSHLTENAFKNQDQELICRAVWEIIILYRAMLKANEEIREADSTLKSHIKDIEALLGLSTKKVSLFDIFLSHKKKVGIKFDSFNPHIIDAYIGLEPTSDTNANNEVAVLKIGEFRKYLNKLLNEKSLIIYILFDRLDDFVIHEEYDVQKLLLQELLSTQRTYREKCTNIKIKTFLRTDLFERLDLNQFGADKIFARCINLSWKSSDIKRFIAQRISHNLLREIPMQRIDFKIDNDRFYIHRDQIPLLKESKDIPKFKFWKKEFWKKEYWQKIMFLISIENRKNEKNGGRISDAMDVVNEEIITSVFPKIVNHKNLSGNECPIDIFKFLDTHLQFSTNETTPRAVLLFFELCLSETRKYYINNSDIKEIPKNLESEFPLFLKKTFLTAYSEFCAQSWKIQHQWAKEWLSLVYIVKNYSHIGNFIFNDFQKKAKIDKEQARQFLAFATHTGLVKCINDRNDIEERRYEIPIIYRQCSTNK